MRVMIIGGGIGGLCLAHGLQKAGINVTVFERQVKPDIRPGASTKTKETNTIYSPAVSRIWLDMDYISTSMGGALYAAVCRSPIGL